MVASGAGRASTALLMGFGLPDLPRQAPPLRPRGVHVREGLAAGLAAAANFLHISGPDVLLLQFTALAPEAVIVRAVGVATGTAAPGAPAALPLHADGPGEHLG